MRLRIGVYAALAIGVCGAANAGPLILEETTRIETPAPDIHLCCRVVTEGDDAIVGATRYFPENPDIFDTLALHFRRNSAGVWTYERTLAELRQDTFTSSVSPRFAMKDGIAAVWLGNLRVFERSTSGWAAVPVQADTSAVQDLEIDDGTILAGHGDCSWSAQPWRKAADGTWRHHGYLQGSVGGCGIFIVQSDVDISGHRAIVFNNSTDTSDETQARIYELGASLPWVHTATLTKPESASRRFGPNVALHGDTALVTSDFFDSIYVFDRADSGAWSHTGTIELPESIPGPHKLTLREGFAFLSYHNVDHRGGVVAVLQRQANGQFQYVARLTASDLAGESDLGGSFDVNGRRVAVGGDGAAYVFDLPITFTQPAPREEDFQTGNASNWAQLAGSGFSVVTAGSSRYFRQSSTAGDARALLTTVDWKNQAIEADVTPTAFPGAGPGVERWVGLIARYQNTNNFYYVTLRSSNVLQLKRMHEGTFTTLASYQLPATLNRTYRLRLEAIGRSLKVYVDGVLATFASDDAISHGQAGLATYKAQANFDNVLVTPNHFTRMRQTDFLGESTAFWSLPLGSWVNTGGVFYQYSQDGDARALTGPNVSDQVVQVKAQPNQFADGGERWFGLIARYKDANNFYYVTLRNSNVISLRKLVNGTITVIANASLPVAPGTTYDLRFSAVGSMLRVWVNGKPVLQGHDTSHATGRFGFATYKTSARYDDLLVYQP